LTWKNYGKPRRRGLSAAASHSKTSTPSRPRYSRYIHNEGQMYHGQTKETILPCGYSVAESWAALKKCWQGFKIANASSDVERMAEYASYIRKVQLEMGISVTCFDPWILEDQQIESDDEANDEYATNKEENILEEYPEDDYDEIMYEARKDLRRQSCDSPRNHLFDSSLEFMKSDELDESDSSVKIPTVDKEISEECNLEYEANRNAFERPGDKDVTEVTGRQDREILDHEEEKTRTLEVRSRKSCVYTPNQDSPRWEVRVRKSCVYRPKEEDQEWDERVRKSSVSKPKKVPDEVEQESEQQPGNSDPVYSHLDSYEVNNNNENENSYSSGGESDQVDEFEENKSASRKSCKYVRK